MDFDWQTLVPGLSDLKSVEIEESFEDSFSLRLLPDSGHYHNQGRYICLGQTMAGKFIFSLYRSNGKQMQVIVSRLMNDGEKSFYERRTRQLLEG